ncbi:hypothetical protein CFO_g4821 [Ceratocystis platani]|uniref:Uncharacterized protein n=1 Tax=Ceratocystis fimbriata f. sp. platani TaxID=88771 RepID=A0A0F8CPZ6_CERFI|nr:hypothetical protein CFO_g4821 [Ceratocystis platani]
MNFGRTALMGSASHLRFDDLPSLTAYQAGTPDAIETFAKATQLEVHTQPGGIHMINSLCLLHRHDALVDGDDPSIGRHKCSPELAIELQDEWRQAFEDSGDRVWHLVPMPDGFYPLRFYAN